MAILTKDEYMKKLHARIGTATDDESIAFVEDMSDTFNDLERRANENSSTDWEKKCKEIDDSWRARYLHRFQTGFDNMSPNYNEEEHEETKRPEDVKITDVLIEKGDN